MSEVVEKTQAPRSRARNNGRMRNVEKNDDGKVRNIVNDIPVPEEFSGQIKTGKICDILKRGRGQFGFIYIGEGGRDVAPRIYFSFKSYIEERFSPRKGYLVEFECCRDESGRAFASDVKLTEDGIKDAEEKEKKYLSSNPDNRREKREIVDDGRNVVLSVTCEGKEEIKQVTANVRQSIGKLKHNAIVAFDAAIDFQVFCRITAEVEFLYMTKLSLLYLIAN
jgi:hypothetical protein